MTTEIDTLRAELDRSPGWQRIREATREGKWEMDPEYFIAYGSFWQNARTFYAGPFLSEADAKNAVADLEVVLDCEMVGEHGRALNISTARQYSIQTADYIAANSAREFVSCARLGRDDDGETESAPLLDVGRIRNLKIRRLLGLALRPGPKPMLSDPETASFVLGADSREQITAIRAARPELVTDTDVVREALRILAGQLEDDMKRRALELRKHDPAVFERLENARLDALEDERDLKDYRAERGDDAPDPLAK